MKGKWYTRAISVTIALSFVLGGLVAAPAVSGDVPPTADPNISKWATQATPTEKDLVILPGSDIINMAVGGDDGEVIYAIGVWFDQCAGDPPADLGAWAAQVGLDDLFSGYQHPKLWKSVDGGVTWKDISDDVLGADNLPVQSTAADTDWKDFTFFSNVAVAPGDSDFVVVAGWGWDPANSGRYIPVVVGSDDGGSNWEYMGSIAGLTPFSSQDAVYITALDVSMQYDVAVGTVDLEAGPSPALREDTAAVWLFDAGKFSSSWVNTRVWGPAGNKKWSVSDVVTDIKFSPNYDIDNTIVVLTIGWSPNRNVLDNGDLPSTVTHGDPGDPYVGYKIQMATTGSVKAWNSAADFGGAYPVLVKNGNNVIVAPTDPSIGGGWGIGEILRRAGHLALPQDFVGYNGTDRRVMVAVNGLMFNPADYSAGFSAADMLGEGGYMFWLMNTTWAPEELLQHEANPYIASIAYHGNVNMMGKTMVGLMFPRDWGYLELMAWFSNPVANPLPTCQGVQVLRSETLDVCCPVWQAACKPPSGQMIATVAYTPDGSMGYAVTQGMSRIANSDVGTWSDESAFSVSGHVGVVGDAWNQSGLIDTSIDVVADVAVSAGGSADPCATDTPCIYIGTLNTSLIETANGNGSDSGWGPGYELKIGDCDSIWRKCATGGWLRIWHKELEGSFWFYGEGTGLVDTRLEWMVLGLAPEEKTNAETLYMADLGSPYVWFSQDSADVCCPAGLGCWSKRNTGLSSDPGIADIAVLNASTVYVVDYDGNVRKSTNNARHWSSSVDSKVDGWHIVAWGDWVLVGGSDGKVGYSDDAGSSFSELDDIGDGLVTVAFDSYFNQNSYVYAAVADPDGDNSGVYRTTIDAAEFKSLNACDDLIYTGIVVSAADGNPKTSASTGGVLYATYVDADCTDSGVARLLNPAAEPCCGEADWDYLFIGLYEEAFFIGPNNNIAISGDQAGSNATIWAIDFYPYYDWWNECLTKYNDGDVGRLWKFVDVFANEGPALISPANNAVIAADDCDDCDSVQFILEWDRVCDACEYDVQIALDPGFTHVVYSGKQTAWPFANSLHKDCDGVLNANGCEPIREFYKPSDPCAPSLVVPAGKLSVNQDYYWRVRARFAETGEAYRSPWSDVRSFTIAASGTIAQSSPANGATGVPRENVVFTWSAVSGATSYQFTLWDANGAEVASSSQANTSFVLGETLDYDSSYTWQVKAMKDGKVINESDIATFRTLVQPVPPQPYPEYPDTVINFPEPPGTPAWVWVVIALAAILIIVVIVLIFRTRRV